jgi:hypothetical protein
MVEYELHTIQREEREGEREKERERYLMESNKHTAKTCIHIQNLISLKSVNNTYISKVLLY